MLWDDILLCHHDTQALPDFLFKHTCNRQKKAPTFWQAASSCFEFLENIFWCILSRSTLYLVRVHSTWRVVKMPLSQRHLHPTREGASNFILEGQIGKKSLIWPLVYEPFSRKHFCLPFLPVTPSSRTWTLEGLLKLTPRPSRTPNVALYITFRTP